MKVTIAKNSGFCFGVENAIDTTIESLGELENVYSLGPLIHNDQVVEFLDKKGLSVVESVDDVKDANLIIRSHGIPLSTYDKAKENNLNVIDCTCPFVRNLQKKARKCHQEGAAVIIVGDANHPEIIGIDGWCDNQAHIVNSSEDVAMLPHFTRACVVAQTTMIEDKFEKLVEEIRSHADQLDVYNTICRATRERQTSCGELSKGVDAMVVVGGKKSSNTTKLAEISRNNCKNVYHVETAEEIDPEEFKAYEHVGLTAGASTPSWIIDEVYEKLKAI